jgi:hypothetical protein
MSRLWFYALTLSLSLALTLFASAALAQESPAGWLARIFDPSKLGVQQYPGAALNRKLSVDTIHLEHGGTKQISISLTAPDELGRASAFFQKQFGVPPQVTGENTQYLTYTYDFTSGDKGPGKLKGLKVIIQRCPYVDNKGQIVMEYTPPPK